MRLQGLRTDDDAVSPVIGVILMVAITVILAAVVASFVLGLGNQTNVTPQASFDSEYDASAENLTITHDSGDAIVARELYLRGSGFNDTTDNSSVSNADNNWSTYWANNMSVPEGDGTYYHASISGQSEGQDAVVAGDSLTVRAANDYELRVVWESSSGESSTTLLEDSGPQA